MDYIELAELIRTMKPRSNIYKFLKTELKARGNWKDAQRGEPSKGYIKQQKFYSQG